MKVIMIIMIIMININNDIIMWNDVKLMKMIMKIW